MARKLPPKPKAEKSKRRARVKNPRGIEVVRAVRKLGAVGKMLLKTNSLIPEVGDQLTNMHSEQWKQRLEKTQGARCLELKELTWEYYYSQRLARQVQPASRPNDPKLKCDRDVKHQLVKLGIYDETYSVLEVPPEGKGPLSKKVHELVRQRIREVDGKPRPTAQKVFEWVLEAVTGDAYCSYGFRTLDKRVKKSILDGNKAFFAGTMKAAKAYESAAKAARIDVELSLESTFGYTGEMISSKINEFNRVLYRRVEEKVRKRKVKEAMDHCRSLVGDTFIENFHVNLNGGNLHVNHHQSLPDQSALAQPISSDERKQTLDKLLKGIDEYKGMFIVPVYNAYPRIFMDMMDEMTRTSRDIVERAALQASVKAILGDEDGTKSACDGDIPWLCTWCEETFDGELPLKNHLDRKESNECVQKLQALDKAFEAKKSKSTFFSLTVRKGELTALQGVRMYKQGHKVNGEVIFPPSPAWTATVKSLKQHFYTMKHAYEAFLAKSDLTKVDLNYFHYKRYKKPA
jgi:hypothetical protein